MGVAYAIHRRAKKRAYQEKSKEVDEPFGHVPPKPFDDIENNRYPGY
jgi:hypothetical protein